MALGNELHKLWSRLTAPVGLTALANRYGSDKGSRYRAAHHYTRVYEPLFGPLRNAPVRVLEIGLLNARAPAWSNVDKRYEGAAAGTDAPSLKMWSLYFPRGSIVGFDINDFSRVSLPRCTIVRGDMGSRTDLQRLIDTAGGDYDIIIDDASHASHHQQVALGFLFEHLRPGGLYIIEDLQWQPRFELAGAPKTRDVLRRAAWSREFVSPFLFPGERMALERDAESVSLFDSLAGGPFKSADALAVIRKRPTAEEHAADVAA
jgi:hypothetical protein